MKNIRNCHPRENDKEAEEKRNGKTKIEKEKKLSRNAQTSQPKDLTKNNKNHPTIKDNERSAEEKRTERKTKLGEG